MNSKEQSYKIGEWGKVYKECIEVFGTDFPMERMVDMPLSYVENRIIIKMDELEKYLRTQGLKDNQSMHDFIISTYGEKAKVVIEKLLGL